MFTDPGGPPLEHAITALLGTHAEPGEPNLLPRLYAITLGPNGAAETIPVDVATASAGGDSSPAEAMLEELTRQAIIGGRLTSGGLPIGPPHALILLHDERSALPGQPHRYLVADGIDVTGEALVASARQGQQPTAVYGSRHTHRPDPAGLRQLLYALTRDPRLDPDSGRILLAAWQALTAPQMPPHRPEPVDAAVAVAVRALAVARLADAALATWGMRIGWASVLATAAEEPSRLREWLLTLGQLLACDLWQVVVAAGWQQIATDGRTPAGTLLAVPGQLETLAGEVQACTSQRLKLLTQASEAAQELGLAAVPPAG